MVEPIVTPAERRARMRRNARALNERGEAPANDDPGDARPTLDVTEEPARADGAGP